MKKFAATQLLILILFICTVKPYTQPIQRRHLLNITSPNSRTDTLYERCSWDRVAFYNMQSNQSQSFGRIQTDSQIGLDGDTLIYAYLTNNQTAVNETISANNGKFIVYFIFIGLGLIALIILGIVFSFCCCNPNGCPPCQNCRQPKGVPYTQCEIRWPAYVIIFLVFITIGIMAATLIVNPTMQEAYNQTRCSIAIFFDDLLNGNYTRDGSEYWIGLKPLKINLGLLTNSVQNILSSPYLVQGSKISNVLLQEIKNLKHQVSDIPNGDGSGEALHLSYTSPINSAPNSSSNSTIESIFTHILGDNSSTFSLVGQTYASLVMAEHTLGSLSDISTFLSQGGPKLSQISNASLIKYASLLDSVEEMNENSDQKMTEMQNNYVTPLLIIVYVISSLVILFAIVLFVVTCMICCYNRFNRRKILYFSIGVLTVLGILTFLLALLFSVSTAGVHYGCHYVEGSFDTQAEFKYRFGPIFNNTILTEMMAQCATKEGNGNLVNSALGTDVHSLVKNTQDTMGNLSHLNADQLIYILNTSKTNLTDTILSYYHAQAMDIDSIPDLQILDKLSNPDEYSCSAPGFANDSWVPSVNQQSVYVTCKVSTTSKVTQQTCPSETQFQTRANPNCIGCIDTFSILKNYSSYDDVLDLLNKRYPLPDCETFTQQLANVWYNFYRKKAQILGATVQRAQYVEQDIDQLNKEIEASYANTISKTLDHLQSNLQSQTTPILKQTITKVDCKVLGEDMVLITNTFCTKVFNYSYILRVFLITTSFCLLGILIFGCCLGIRVYRMSELGILPQPASKSYAYYDGDIRGQTAVNKIAQPTH